MDISDLGQSTIVLQGILQIQSQLGMDISLTKSIRQRSSQNILVPGKNSALLKRPLTSLATDRYGLFRLPDTCLAISSAVAEFKVENGLSSAAIVLIVGKNPNPGSM